MPTTDPRFTETITVKRKSGVSASGDPTYGTAFTMPARIERASLRQVTGDGDALNDTTVLYTADPILQSDIVWFPEDDTGSSEAAHRPAIVAPERDLDGVIDHFETSF